MDEPQSAVPTNAAAGDQADQPVHLRPVGLSAVELAARRGIGPLSPLGNRVWHGEARPCASCGQLVRRTQETCDQCGQDLSPAMLNKMRTHSGPWYVLEHVRPFPGVSLARLIRQIRRGVLTRTTVVRGPTTDHQWRFAAETPVLCRYLGCCWACQVDVRENETTCPDCGVDLNAGSGSDQTSSAGASDAVSAELDKLSAALSAAPGAEQGHRATGPARVGRVPVSWIVVGLVIVTLVAILVVVRVRSGATESGASKTVSPKPVEPAPSPAPTRAGEPTPSGTAAGTPAVPPAAAGGGAPAGGGTDQQAPPAAQPAGRSPGT